MTSGKLPDKATCSEAVKYVEVLRSLRSDPGLARPEMKILGFFKPEPNRSHTTRLLKSQTKVSICKERSFSSPKASQSQSAPGLCVWTYFMFTWAHLKHSSQLSGYIPCRESYG